MTATSVIDTAPPSRSADAKPAHPGFRADIEGLRAVAIGLVLVYHAGVRFVPGGFVGVDVFFVISGFLITGLIIREVERTGRLSLVTFYARRAKRLLPATALVLVAAAAVTWVALPITQRDVFGWDIIAAAFYVVNWMLASRSVDYLAEGVTSSPVQHFWSLAVEEQFYIVWPLVIVVLVWAARRFRLPLRPALGVGLAAVAIPSFLWSVHLTGTDPNRAYFVTTTRLWELGIGAAVALTAGLWAHLARRAGATLVLVGLAVIVGSALLLDGTVPWPGWHAAYPVVGTAMVIIGGASGRDSLGARALALRPMVWVGGLSYSLYLWHWPLLVGAGALWGELGAKRGLLVVAVAFVPAWLSYTFVEHPVRSSTRVARSNRLALSIGAGCAAVGLAAGLVLVAPSLRAAPEAGPAAGDRALGSHDTSTPWSLAREEAPFSPDPLRATDDVPVIYDDNCQSTSAVVAVCEYGDADGDLTLALVGDSMAAQWQPALDTIGKERGFRVVTVLKAACAFTDATLPYDGEVFTDCRAWNDAALATIIDLAPDALLTSQGAYRALSDVTDLASATPDAMASGLATRWKTLADADVPVVALAKNPNPPGEIYECVAQHPEDLGACAFPADEIVADVQRSAAAKVDDVPVLSLNDRICPGGVCPPVIGDVLLYRQGSHLTKTYVESMTDTLDERLMVLLPASFRD